MNHYNWTYVAGGGRNIPVGLYHSSKKGHLMIYVGKKITTIDFHVLDSKDYSFFIDNELCWIKLKRKGDEMYYYFEIDRKADTPMNRARWAMEKKFLKQLVIGLAFFAIVVTTFTFYLKSQKQPHYTRIDDLLENGAVESVAKVVVEEGSGQPQISYHFIAKNEAISSKTDYQNEPFVMLVNGMPLESGDEFVVKYSPSNPAVNRIDFKRPTKEQIQAYIERAAAAHLNIHPNEAPHLVACMVAAAYEIEGIGGLADFYFQNTPPKENPNHNTLSYSRLVRSLPFQKKIEKDCWK